MENPIIDSKMVIIIILSFNFQKRECLLRASKPLFIIIKLTVGTNKAFIMFLLTLILIDLEGIRKILNCIKSANYIELILIIHAFKLGFLGNFEMTAFEPCRIEPQQIRMAVEFRVSIEAITSKYKKAVIVTKIHMVKYKFLKESTIKREL
jgi:hypothetical protein